MKKGRRHFLKTGALGASLSMVSPSLALSGSNQMGNEQRKARRKLNILILGGTSFLGPPQVAYALERGHNVSIFTRGKTKPTIHKEAFDHVEHLIGDRQDNLKALENRSWDAVIDNSGNRVNWVKDTATLLKDQADLYLFTSSTGVYYPYLKEGITEDQSLVTKVPEGITKIQGYEYGFGVMKANSEMEVLKAFGKDRSINVRPTYMMGPGDRTDRFTYWPVRLAKGGEVMIPGKADDPVQYVDARDIARWMVRLIEDKNTGTFNGVGPASPTGMHQFVYGAHAAFSSEATFFPIPSYELLEQNQILDAIPWIMPVGDNYGSARVDNTHGIKNGLTFTPLANSVQDIYEWWMSDAVSKERKEKMASGLMAKEKSLIEQYKKM